MIKKINFILDKNQKTKIVILLAIILVGAFIELLGVSAILPLINVALDPNAIESTWYLAMIKDIFAFQEAKQVIIFLSFFLIGVYVFKNVYLTMMYNMQYQFIFNNQRRLAVKMMNAYMNESYLFHVSRNVAELQRNVTEDVNGFYTVVLNLLQFIAEASVSIVLVVFLMKTDAMTTVVVATLIFFLAVLFGVVFKKVLVKKGQENRKISIKLSKWLLQSFSGIKEIKVMSREKFFVDEYDKSYKRFAILQRQQTMLSFIPRPIMESVCICGLLIALIVKLLCFNEDVTSFIPSLSVFAIAAFRMLPSFNRISGFMGTIMFNRNAIDVLYDDLIEIDELTKRIKGKKHEKRDVLKLQTGIDVKGVSFRYPNAEKWILKDLDMHIESNTSIALIGASGAGKTTLVDVILGILEPQEGHITVDDMDVSENVDIWHNSLGYIPQTIYLMDDTIKANIAFGLLPEQIDENAIWKAIREAQLEEFVKGLPQGIETVIGDRGVKLSGGQRQRIGIARALYKKPKVLVLDEATSALDNETEREVMEAIDELHGSRTLIIIAHRLSTIKNCDVIYEVSEGKVLRKAYQDIL